MFERSKGSDLVFAEYHAGPAYLSKPAHWFPEIVKAAGIENFTWHSPRHDFASQLVMKGVNLKAVQELMCHANIKQTAIYADLSPAHLQSAVDCLVDTPVQVLPKPGATKKRSATKTATQVIELAASG
jgi:site-specific recombinase XerD